MKQPMTPSAPKRDRIPITYPFTTGVGGLVWRALDLEATTVLGNEAHNATVQTAAGLSLVMPPYREEIEERNTVGTIAEQLIAHWDEHDTDGVEEGHVHGLARLGRLSAPVAGRDMLERSPVEATKPFIVEFLTGGAVQDEPR